MAESADYNRRDGDEDEDEDEIDETVGASVVANREEQSLTSITGLQDDQRCCALRHRSQPVHACSSTSIK